VASHCLESNFDPTPVQIVVSDRSPRFHSYSQTRALVSESLEVAQNQLPKIYSKNKLRRKEKKKILFFLLGLWCSQKTLLIYDISIGGIENSRVNLDNALWILMALKVTTSHSTRTLLLFWNKNIVLFVMYFTLCSLHCTKWIIVKLLSQSPINAKIKSKNRIWTKGRNMYLSVNIFRFELTHWEMRQQLSIHTVKYS